MAIKFYSGGLFLKDTPFKTTKSILQKILHRLRKYSPENIFMIKIVFLHPIISFYSPGQNFRSKYSKGIIIIWGSESDFILCQIFQLIAFNHVLASSYGQQTVKDD